MILCLSTLYDGVRYLTKRIELKHSSIFYSQMYEPNRTIKQFNCQILPIYIRIILILWSKLASSHSMMYVRNETITFYNFAMSNVPTRLTYNKPIVIFYNVLAFFLCDQNFDNICTVIFCDRYSTLLLRYNFNIYSPIKIYWDRLDIPYIYSILYMVYSI